MCVADRILVELETLRARISRAISILRGDEAQPLSPVRRKRRRTWSEKQHATLREMYGKVPDAEIAALLHKTPCAIKSRVGVLGLTKGNKKIWTAEEDEQLRQLYPDTPNEDLVQRFGVKLHQLYGHAKHLGVGKSAKFMELQLKDLGKKLVTSGKAHRFPRGHPPANKGTRRPGWFAGRMRETQFKKGQRAGAAQAKWVPVGTIRKRDGYLYRKIADLPESIAGKGGSSTNWELVHIRTWEDANGPVPEGFAVSFKDGNRENIGLGNLELISRADLMLRNTIHNLPQPLREVIQLKGAIRRHITVRSRANAKEQNRGPAQPPLRDIGSAEGRRESYGS